MDRLEKEILSRFEARADEIADEIADASLAEVPGFAPIRDGRLRGEIRSLARHHLDAFIDAVHADGTPSPQILASARERAVMRAREMVPLAALLHSYMIAQRVITAAISREAGPDADSRGAALALTAKTFDYNIATTSAMAEAYVEVVQGDLADLDAARRALVDTLLSAGTAAWPELTRRAIGLGFDTDSRKVVVLAGIDLDSDDPHTAPTVIPRWAAQTVARASGRLERKAFVVCRDQELVALLDAGGSFSASVVLSRVAATLQQRHGAQLRAGIGTAFVGLSKFSVSYAEALRALRHTSASRPILVGPADIPLFDELTVTAGEEAARLIPRATAKMLADPTLLATVEAFVAADLNVATAAKKLTLHPNSLRYRLRRIAEMTGRDPRKLNDLLELVAAARFIAARAGTTRHFHLPE